MDNLRKEILNDSLLAELYLNFSDYHVDKEVIIFESKFSTFFQRPIEYMDNDLIKRFSNMKMEQLAILKSRLVESRTLEDIAKEYTLTRERVRQIESNIVPKLLAHIGHENIIDMRNLINRRGVYYIDDIEIKDDNLRLFYAKLLSHKKSRYKIVYDDALKALVKSKEYSFNSILSKIEDFLISKNESLFEKDDLVIYLESLFPYIDNIEKLLAILIESEKLRVLNDGRYFLLFLYKPKKPMIEFVFSLYSEGIELHKNISSIREQLDIFFPNIFTKKDEKRSIITLAGYSDNILLWDWGKHIHIKYINAILEVYSLTSIVEYIDEHLEDTQIDLETCFQEFEEELITVGIISKYALHTCLKLNYAEDYSFQDSPWIAKAGTERRELKQTLRNLLIENRNYSLDELVESMHTNKTRVQQLIDNTYDVIQVEAYLYKKKEFLSFSNDLFMRIVEYIEVKVNELDFIYIELIIDEFEEELSQYNEYDLKITLLELLKKNPENKKYNVSNTRVVKRDHPLTRDSLNFHVLIKELLGDRDTISINEIANYFVKRGLSQDRIMMYFRYSKLKEVVRLNTETFTGIDKIGLTKGLIDKVNLLLENSLSDEVHIDDIIKSYKLPTISVEWSRFILTDISDFTKFTFSPSRENPIYISKK